MRATLTYHSVDPSGSAISVHPDAFSAHLRWLTSGRIRVLPLEDLIATADEGPDAVALTFDDGFVSTREPIRRLLAEHLPVTVFVVTAEVGRSNAWGGRPHPSVPTLPLLSWNDLEDLKARGASIEAHTRTHAALSSLSDAALDDELSGCRADLEARLGTSTHLAYPYGDVDRRVESRAAAVFRFGHTTEFRPLRPRERPLGLPRLDMYYFAATGTIERWNQPGTLGRIGLRRLVRHGLLGLPAPGRPRRWTR
jgi:peptidoglycan/xylan/chitin deacetylase (PgdA/CDA1 family)